MNRIEALAEFLAIEVDEELTIEDYVAEDSYTENAFDAEGGTYLVLTDEEADAAAKEYIADSLWTFNAEFLASETDLPEEVFTALQERCEGANETFRKLIDGTCGLDEFADSAISADGRGHFLAQYDHNENEQGEYFIYRTN